MKSLLTLFWILPLLWMIPENGPTIDNTKVKQTKWTATAPETVVRGETISITFHAKILDDNWHLYSAQYSESFSYMPTEFYLDKDGSKGVQLEGHMEDLNAPFEKKDEIMGGMIRYFKDKEVDFKQNFKITGKRPVIKGEISGQLCLDPDEGGQCIPLRIPMEWTVPLK